MVSESLILKLFDAFYMQRWNDRLRPMELIELDKQAHKMGIAYFLGKFEESCEGFDWLQIIEGGIFELFQRIVITDIKPPVYYKIKADTEKYRMLNDFVYKQLEPYIAPLGEAFCNRFRMYFKQQNTGAPVSINKQVLDAAHIYASKWEFDIIERLNPDGYEIRDIKCDFISKIESFGDLNGMKHLKEAVSNRNFIDLFGNLRFQARWAQVHRIPKTSVLGHSLFVAILAYLFSLETGANPQKCSNNYFTGLFHDLPEVLTRDIISPVKSSIEGLGDLIKDIEKEQMQKVLYPMLPSPFREEIKLFTENEFADISSGKNARDGSLVKVMDDVSAFIEAFAAQQNGCRSEEFSKAMEKIKAKYKDRLICDINVSLMLERFTA